MASVQIIDSTDKQETRRAGQGRYKPDVLLKNSYQCERSQAGSPTG